MNYRVASLKKYTFFLLVGLILLLTSPFVKSNGYWSPSICAEDADASCDGVVCEHTFENIGTTEGKRYTGNCTREGCYKILDPERSLYIGCTLNNRQFYSDVLRKEYEKLQRDSSFIEEIIPSFLAPNLKIPTFGAPSDIVAIGVESITISIKDNHVLAFLDKNFGVAFYIKKDDSIETSPNLKSLEIFYSLVKDNERVINWFSSLESLENEIKGDPELPDFVSFSIEPREHFGFSYDDENITLRLCGEAMVDERGGRSRSRGCVAGSLTISYSSTKDEIIVEDIISEKEFVKKLMFEQEDTRKSKFSKIFIPLIIVALFLIIIFLVYNKLKKRQY